MVRDEYGSGDYDEVSYNLSYAELPLTLKVYFNKSKLRFFALGGAYIGYLHKGTEKEVSMYGTSKEKSSEEMDLEDYDLEGRIDAGIKTGVGAQYDFKFGSVFVNPSFHVGLTDVDTNQDDQWVNRTMLVNVGYLYTFHKKGK
ncbi:MAG: PorT family protein [Bacteroidetes bacterium]|nr:PorT family protein [Bacteroidota bacterium]